MGPIYGRLTPNSMNDNEMIVSKSERLLFTDELLAFLFSKS